MLTSSKSGIIPVKHLLTIWSKQPQNELGCRQTSQHFIVSWISFHRPRHRASHTFPSPVLPSPLTRVGVCRPVTQLRGGYYPRIFYPGLYNATQRFLKNFETVYYLKAVPGGWIFRKAPEDWQARVTRGRGTEGARGYWTSGGDAFAFSFRCVGDCCALVLLPLIYFTLKHLQ